MYGIKIIFLATILLLPLLSCPAWGVNPDRARINLLPDEKIWLEHHKTVKVGITPIFPPLKYAEHGILKGIEPDYLALLTEYTGIPFEPVITDLSSLDTKIQTGAIDMFLSYKVPKRQSYVIFSEPLLEFKQVFVTRNDAPFISGFGALDGQKFVCVKGVRQYDTLLAAHPEVETVWVDTMEQMFRTVAEHKADALITKTLYAGYLIQNFPNLKIAGVADLPPDPLLYAIRKDSPVLARMINRGITSIPKDRVDALIQKWHTVRVEYRPNWHERLKWLLPVGSVFFFISGVILYWNRRLRNEISKRKLVEDELLTAKVAAESANTAKSEFLANISHEIRTPLNGVIGNTQLFRFTELTEEQGQLLACIESDAKSLVSVINDVLDISKIEAGKLEIEQAPFNLRRCLDDLLKPLEFRIRSKGLSLALEISDDIPDTLSGDQLRLKQVLLNLISNAIKFTEQGSIGVRVELVERTTDAARFLFSIADTGIGMTSEQLTKIFEPFSQADSSVTRRFGGTGLGLAICIRLAGLMEGSLTVESKETEGSTFYLTLPFLIREEALEQQQPAPSPEWDQKPQSILLVDDSQTNRIMAEKLLRRFGHKVVSAENGANALEQWQTDVFDIILMDVQMPTMDGIEATRLIREHEKKNGTHIPIIALTAHALQEQKETLLSSGFDGYVSKPVEISTLFEEMRRVLN